MDIEKRKTWKRRKGIFVYQLLRSRLFIILYSFLTFYLIHHVLQQVYTPDGTILNESWDIVNSAGENTNLIQTSPFYRITEKPESIRLKQLITYQKGDFLVLPRISGNRAVIFINEHEIFTLGGPAGTGNIWSGFYWVELPGEYAEAETSFEIELYGIYDIGIRESPYLISGLDTQWFRFFTQFIFFNIYWFVLGIVIILGVIQVFYSFIDQRLQNSYLFNAAGILFGSIYLMDFIYRPDSGDIYTYLLLRKFLITCGFIAPWFFLAGMEYYTRKKYRFSSYMIFVTAVSVILILQTDSPYELKRILIYSAALAQINWIILFFIALKNHNDLIIYAAGFYLFTLLSSIFTMFFQTNHIYMIHIGYMFANISIAYSIMEEFGQIHADYKKAYKKSMLDPLTNAYNRFILEGLEADPDDVIILADMNNFKLINDRYGHEAGDRVLVEWVSSVKDHIRENDLVIRLGGDEFLILFKGAKDNIMEKIAEDFAARLQDLPVSFSYGIERVGESIKEAISRADSKMYSHKKLEKSRSWFKNIFR